MTDYHQSVTKSQTEATVAIVQAELILMAPQELTASQSRALLDILTHHETYKEIADFNSPGPIKSYGPPFQKHITSPSSPILQSLLSKFALTLPGLSQVKPCFWDTYVHDLLQELSEAELSESYDKGVLGIRKTLATAIAALLEYPARGILDGVEERMIDNDREYDSANPNDVMQAWPDCMQQLVYGDLVDRIFDAVARTEDLDQHENLVQSLHEFIIVNVASLMHYTLVLSPEGPNLLRLIENIHKLLPYAIMRQTLRIGNVATMLSGMMRVILAKASVASITNWMGWTQGADEGMNLLQSIMSQIMGWDKRELKKRVEKIEKGEDAPPKEVQDELLHWMRRSREEHEECRRQSQERQESIVTIILALSSCSEELSEAQHQNAMEYLSLQLSMRDRDEILKALCQRNPDHLSAMVREGVEAYTPMIRHIHQAVNLADTLWDFERFVTDMLKVSKGASGTKEHSDASPAVGDFVDLLHRHQSSSHKFIHQVAKNGKEVTKWWRDYVQAAAEQFRRSPSTKTSNAVIPADVTNGGVREKLQHVFIELSDSDRQKVAAELDNYGVYLDALYAKSAERVHEVMNRKQKTLNGPGSYLFRWQQLMSGTLVTPATRRGLVRFGGSSSVLEQGRRAIDGRRLDLGEKGIQDHAVLDAFALAPSTAKVMQCFQEQFRRILSSGD